MNKLDIIKDKIMSSDDPIVLVDLAATYLPELDKEIVKLLRPKRKAIDAIDRVYEITYPLMKLWIVAGVELSTFQIALAKDFDNKDEVGLADVISKLKSGYYESLLTGKESSGM